MVFLIVLLADWSIEHLALLGCETSYSTARGGIVFIAARLKA